MRGRHALEPARPIVLTRRELRQLERVAEEEQQSRSNGGHSPVRPSPPQDEPIAGGSDPEPAAEIEAISAPDPLLVTSPVLPTEWLADITPVSVASSREATPPRVPPPTSATAAPTPKRRSSRMRALVALSFAALLVATTSLSATNSSLSFASTPATTDLRPQELLTVAAAPGQPITRDGYSVTEAEVIAEKKAEVAGYRTANTFTNNPTSAVQWPFPVGVPISDGFGPRESPGGIGSTNHKGVDFTPGEGTPVNAVAAGVVRLVQQTDQGGLGVYVVVDHVIDGVNVSSWYGHMLTGSPVVTEGQVVVAGQQLGNVGNTGVSTGAHTHLEIHVEDTPVDPYAWISARN